MAVGVLFEDIALEAKLASRDVDSGVEIAGTVTRLFKATSVEIVTISFDDETLRCTPRHRFFTTSGWTPAGRLSQGMEVCCLGGRMRQIVGVSVEPAESPVFNLRVDLHHTYFVGETGYLVHNVKDQGDDGGDLGDDIPGSTEDKKRSPPTLFNSPKSQNLGGCPRSDWLGLKFGPAFEGSKLLAGCSVVEAKFGLFEEEGKGAFGMPLYRLSVRLAWFQKFSIPSM